MSKDTENLTLKSVLYLSAGIIIATVSQILFLIPNKIVPSGLVGLGTILYHKTGFPIGIFTMAGNFFLILLQWRLLGLKQVGKTVIPIILQGFLLDGCISVIKISTFQLDPLLASVYGGILTGLGVAMIFKGGGTLGGSDILAQLLLKFRQIPAGTTFFWSDFAVLGAAGLVYGPQLALYALIKSFIVGQTVDQLLEGSSIFRQALIISHQAETISWGIMEELHRGVTILNGRGAYTNKPAEVLLTAVRRREVPLLEEIVYRIDPNAFLIITDARRVIGRGFTPFEDLVEIKPRSPHSADNAPAVTGSPL